MVSSTTGSSTVVSQLTSRAWIFAVLCFAGSCLLYSINITRFPHPDELYHVLAARGILETGEPRIADGIYERVYLYTWLISRFFLTFGDSLAIARLPSILTMAASVSILFLWLYAAAGPRAAWIGAVLFAISPFAVDIAQFVRFYGLQTAVFLSGAILVYSAVENLLGKRWLWAVLSLPFFITAVYLQETSLVGLVGLGSWLSLRLTVPWLRSEEIPAMWKAAAAASMLLLMAAALTAAWMLGILQDAWATYRSVPLFNRAQADEFWYYHAWFNLLYPSIWPALGIIGLAAIAYRPGPAFFAGTVFLVCFLLNSFAAPKSLRYFIYAQPFGFAVLGMGLAVIIPRLSQWLGELRNRLAMVMPARERTARSMAGVLMVLSIGILLLGNPASLRTATMLAGITIPPERPPVDWAMARKDLRPWLRDADVIVTMAELEMLYYYGQYDILISESRLQENPGAVDFDIDFRTGKPIIASYDAVSRVITCYRKGVVVTNKRRWRDGNLTSAEISNLIALRARPIDLPKESNVIAFQWTNEASSPKPELCMNLPDFRENEQTTGG